MSYVCADSIVSSKYSATPNSGPRPRSPLFMSNWEWFQINDSIHRQAREKAIAEQNMAKEYRKKEMSYQMTKNWTNTLTSIKEQSEQRRTEMTEKTRQERINSYNKILEDRKEKRQLMLEDVRRALFETRNSTRTIATAMANCEVITERKKQIEFKNARQAEADEKERMYSEDIFRDVEEYKKEMVQKEIEKIQKKRALRNDLIEQMEERKKGSLLSGGPEKEKKAIEEDMARIKEYGEKLSRCKRLEKMEDIKRTRAGYEKGYHLLDLEKKMELEREEEAEINYIYKKYANKYACERKRIEKEEIEKKILEREKKVEELVQKMNAAKEEEEGFLDKAKQEYEEEEQRKEKEKEETRRKMKEEMKKWDESHRREIEEEKIREREARKWTMLQAFRTQQVDQEWRAEMKRKDQEMKRITRENYAQQIREKEELLAETQRLDELLTTSTEERDSFLRYCKEAVEYVTARGWDTYPLLDTIARMKKEFGVTKEGSGGAEDERKRTGKEGESTDKSQRTGKNEDADGCGQNKDRCSRLVLGPLNAACYCFRN